MKKVGLIGWRGMVGSVLVERMRAERDFDLIAPTFFSTSQAGSRGPDIGRDAGVGEDVGVDDQNVGHRGEGRQAGLEFTPDGGLMVIELEEALQHGRWGAGGVSGSGKIITN